MKATQPTVEQWLPVVGFEDYEVSNLGRVRSLDRLRRTGEHGGMKPYPGRVLRPISGKDGRPQVTVSTGALRRTLRVHVIVAKAFLGPCPDGFEVCHGNGDCTDNRLSNLRYDTKSENQFDRVRHGTHHNANKTHCPHGHEYTAANTKVSKGKRFCKACAANDQRRRRAQAA